jgi:hypothetical protein
MSRQAVGRDVLATYLLSGRAEPLTELFANMPIRPSTSERNNGEVPDHVMKWLFFHLIAARFEQGQLRPTLNSIFRPIRRTLSRPLTQDTQDCYRFHKKFGNA